MNVYQIRIEGQLQNFSGRHVFRSFRIFTVHPSKEEIETFTKLCCADGLFDIKREGSEVSISKLKLVTDK